jgi:hypothetical protein
MNPMTLMGEIFGLVAVLSKDKVDVLFNDIMNVLGHHGGGQPGPATTSADNLTPPKK